MVASISSSSVSNWADSVFSKLDTKKQGYIDKSDLQDALSKLGGKDGAGQALNVDDTFSALDGDSDGKITKSELTDAMTKLSDQLNAQFDASRAGGGHRPDGPPPEGPPPQAGGAGGTSGSTSASTSTSASESTSSSANYVAAADTDGNGAVSDAEQAAYEKKLASEQAGGGGHPKDPMRELAHALRLLKAYAENGGGDTSTASTADAAGGNGSVNVEA